MARIAIGQVYSLLTESRTRATALQKLMSYTFETDDSDEDEPTGPFREVGQVGKMPIPAEYDYDRIRRWANQALRALQTEETSTDEALASTINLDAIAQEYKTYDPDDYHRQAVRESSDRDSDEQARRAASKRRAQDQKALLYYHRGPVLATHDDVEWRATWTIDVATAPGDLDTVRELAESFDVPWKPTEAIVGMVDVAREVERDQDRGVSTYELLTDRRVPDLSQHDLDEAARFLDEEVPGIDPPASCDYVTWADAPASWIYLPAQETDAETQEVADVGV